MLEKLKKWAGKIFLKDEDYDFVLDDVCENNRKSIIVLGSICVAIFSVLVTLGLFNAGVEGKDVPVFLGALIYAIFILIIVKIWVKSYVATMIASYLTMAAVVFYGLIISYLSPDRYTVSFIAMMCIMSMTFVDRPLRIGLGHILATAVCVGMICIHKTEAVRVADLINVMSFSVLSFIGGLFTVNMRVHGYAMDKLHEADLKKGRQRLNEKEIEALQLLTAVKSTHDMVVSVNLTQNSYKLIGDESFVTQGDDLEGVFDDVIDIHACKVVDEHRQKYLDTFSRKALLKAHAEGKRAVYLEYMQRDEEGEPHWLATHTMFIDNPKSNDVTEITISQNVDERVRKDAEIKAILKEERDKAERAQKAKTEFLFQMSHDIRTPMNAIIGFANFIKDSNDIDTIHNEYVVKLQTAGKQLLMLIDDALEMSRIESGKLVFKRDIQDIRTVISNVIEVMQVQAGEKNIEMTAEYLVDHPVVNFDVNHMSRVVTNLLSNAVKFTPNGGSVKVTLNEKPNAPEGFTAFELKIADTGIGMSADFVKKVFEPFEREQTSTVSGMQGTGLGLAIVKRIVDAAGDEISVESKQGEGTVFTLNMTLYRAEEADFQGVSALSNLPNRAKMAEFFNGKRVLLVEDNGFNLTIAQTILEKSGFIVETATDGSSAVSKVVEASPDYYDAVLMDVQMPIMNGYEATERIRSLEDERANTVIIAVTANAFDTDRENALSAGMNGHIAKPIDVDVLCGTLWNILRGRN